MENAHTLDVSPEDKSQPTAKTSKRRLKTRSKVWEKVAWFTRKTKQGKGSKENTPETFRKADRDRTLRGRNVCLEADIHFADSRFANSLSCNSVKTKPKFGVKKSRSFNYLRKRKLKQFDQELDSVFVEESNCQTATGTFHDFSSERTQFSRRQRDVCSSTNNPLLCKMAREIGIEHKETTKQMINASTEQNPRSLSLNDCFVDRRRKCNDVSKSIQDFPNLQSCRSFCSRTYNTWPRKTRFTVDCNAEPLSPPTKQKRIIGLRKSATFNGFDSFKIGIINHESLGLGTSTPFLSGHSQIMNQNGKTVGVIHFFKSPQRSKAHRLVAINSANAECAEAISRNKMTNVDLMLPHQKHLGMASEEEYMEFQDSQPASPEDKSKNMHLSNTGQGCRDTEEQGYIENITHKTLIAMGSSLGAVATMKECFVVEDESVEFSVIPENSTTCSALYPEVVLSTISSKCKSIDEKVEELSNMNSVTGVTGLGLIEDTGEEEADNMPATIACSENYTFTGLTQVKVSDNEPMGDIQHSADNDSVDTAMQGTSHFNDACTSDSLPVRCLQNTKETHSRQLMNSNEKQSLSKKHGLICAERPKVDGSTFMQQTEAFLKWFAEFNDEQKNILIRKILDKCELPQMHLLSVLMEPILHKTCPSNCQDMLAWLPHNVTSVIMSYLDPVSLCRCSLVNRLWHDLANMPALWQRLCSNDEWKVSRVGEKQQFQRHTLPSGIIQWKKMFAERFLLRKNWLNGRCDVRTFEGHTQGISCVQFDDTRIVSGSSDKTIKVWDLSREDTSAVLTLAGHSGTVRCLNLNGNRLVSGSVDRSIKVWDLSFESYWSGASCKVTMVGHMHTVRCLQVDDEKVVSGSYDKTLKVWDIKTGNCKLTLRGHNAAVLCVQFDESKIVSGSYDNTIKVWSLVEGSCLMTLAGHHDAVTCLNLTLDRRKVISGSLDHNLKFWDLATGKCIGTLDWIRSEGHTGVIRCLQSDSWRIVSAGDDKTLKMWSLESGQRLLTLRCHTDGVTCLQFNDYRIVSGSYDKTVKVWDFSPKHEFLSHG